MLSGSSAAGVARSLMPLLRAELLVAERLIGRLLHHDERASHGPVALVAASREFTKGLGEPLTVPGIDGIIDGIHCACQRHHVIDRNSGIENGSVPEVARQLAHLELGQLPISRFASQIKLLMPDL